MDIRPRRDTVVVMVMVMVMLIGDSRLPGCEAVSVGNDVIFGVEPESSTVLRNVENLPPPRSHLTSLTLT